MMVLFTNHTYGQQFAQAFLDYCQQQELAARIVFSVFYGNPQKHAQADAFIDELHQALRGSELVSLEKAEVNSEAFLMSLEANSGELQGIVAGFNQIFKAPLISFFRSLVNIHPSLLPFYRGPVPSYWAIENRERYSGFSFLNLGLEIDRGEVLHQQVVEISKDDSATELDQKIARQAVPVMLSYLRHLTEGEPFATQKVNARDYLKHPVDYLSFPEKEHR